MIRRWRCAYHRLMAGIPSGSKRGEDDLSARGYAERRWRCAYRDPEVALRLPPANGCDPFGIEEGGARFIQPAVTRTGGSAALTVIRWWRCAYHRLMAVIPSGSKRGEHDLSDRGYADR